MKNFPAHSSIARLVLWTAWTWAAMPAMAAAAESFDLKGKVLDPSGKPVAGAMLFIGSAPAGSRQATSQADGSYALKDLLERSVTVQISRDGYFPRTVLIRPKAGFERHFCLVPESDPTPWLGLELDEQYEADARPGDRPKLVVVAVEPESPAARAAVRYGDEIISFNGKPVSSEVAFYGLLAASRVGQDAPIEFRKREEQKTLVLRVERRQTTREAEQVRQKAAESKTHEVGPLVYYREAAIAQPPGIGSAQGRNYMLQRPGAVDVAVQFPADGAYQIQVIAFGGAEGKGPARWSLLLDGRELQAFTTESAYFHIHEAAAQVTAGTRVLRVLYGGTGAAQPGPLYLYAIRVLRTRQTAAPSQPATASPEKFLEQLKADGKLLWTKEDSEDSALTWVAIKDGFLALIEKGAPQPVQFTAFLDSLDQPKLNVRTLLLTRTEVWAGTDGGLFQYDRHLRKWYQWAIEGKHIVADVKKLELAPGGRLLVDYQPADGSRGGTAAFDTASRQWVVR